MQTISDYKSVIFDCDGVILQSNKLKTNAFSEVLSSEPKKKVDDFINYHKTNGGVSRYVKFEYYFREIKHEKNYKQMAEKAILQYAKIVKSKLKRIDYVPGFLEIINYFNSKKVPCFIISGGDQDELHEIFQYRQIFDKFKCILGSPIEKESHVKNLLMDNFIIGPAIFFGDASSDMKAAINNQIEFCFVKQFSEWKDGERIAKQASCMVIENFEEIL